MKIPKANKVILGVILGLTFFLVGGCGKKPAENMVTLRWVSDPNPLRKEQIARFEKVNPGIKINFDWASSSLQKVLTQTAAGVPPDLIDCHFPDIFRIFAQKGALLDITDYCKNDKVNLKDIWEGCSPWMYYKDRVYAIPTNAGTVVLFYNKKIFDKEGIPYPDETWTWDKFLEVAKRLTKVDPQKRVYHYFGTGFDQLETFLPWQYGGSFYSEDGKGCICNSPAYKDAYRFIYDLRYKYHVTPTPEETQSMDTSSAVKGWGINELNLFSSGRLAMLFSGRYGIINMRKVKDLEWGVAPVPYPKFGKRVTFFAARSTGISPYTKHPEDAFKFLKFLLTEDYNQTVTHGGDGIPAVISLAQSNLFLYDSAYPKEDQNKVFLDAVKYSRTIHLSPYFDEIEVGKIRGEELDKMWARLQGPEETLDNIAQRVNKLTLSP